MNDKEESPFLLEALEEATKEDKKEENKTFQYTIISEDNVYKIKNQDNQKVEINESENPNLKKCLDEILKSFKTKQNGNSNKKIFIYLKLDDNNNIISGEIKIGNKGNKENFELSDEIKKELQNTLFCLKTKFSPEQVKDTIKPVKSLDADSVVSDSEPQPQPQPVPEEIKSQDNKYWKDILKEEKIMPGDGNCLFWSAMMAYLDPFKDDEEQFKINCMKLFGNQNNWEVLFNNFSKISNTGHKDNNFKDSNDYKTIKSSMLKFRTNVIEHMETFATSEDVEIFLTEEFVEDFNEKNNSILKAENLLPLAANDLKNYYLIMKKDGVFADQFELKFISKFLECNVIFFQDNVISFIVNSDNGFKENIVLNYVNKDHYNYYSYAHNSVNHEKQVLVTATPPKLEQLGREPLNLVTIKKELVLAKAEVTRLEKLIKELTKVKATPTRGEEFIMAAQTPILTPPTPPTPGTATLGTPGTATLGTATLGTPGTAPLGTLGTPPLATLTPIEEWYQWMGKVGFQFFKLKDLSTKSDKEKIEQYFNKELQKLKKEVLKEGILFFFKTLEEIFFHPFREKISTFENEIIKINSQYKKQLNEIKNSDEFTPDQKKAKIDALSLEFKVKRVEELEKFEKYINSEGLLSELNYFFTHNPQIVKVFKEQLLLHEDINPEYKKQYQDMLKTIIKFKDRFEKHESETKSISENYNKLPDYLESIQITKQKNEISEALVAGIVANEDNISSFSWDNGEPANEVVKKLVYLEKNLLFKKQLNNISGYVTGWRKEIEKIFEIKAEIKELKPYKNLTIIDGKLCEKKGNLDFKVFHEKNENIKSQYVLVSEKRKELINKYLIVANTKNHTFENTIGKALLSEEERKWDKFTFFWFKKPFTWIGEATHINKNSNWISKPFLVLFSPLTIPYAAIKSVNHKLRKTKNPKIYLEDDIKTLKQFKEDLDKKYEAIRIKYAKLMAIPLEERSIFSIKKTDSDYLKAAQTEIEKAIFQFQLKCKAITDHYENFVTKQDSKFSSKGTTIKKMEDILEKIENYAIKDVEAKLEERMTEPDYERQELSHNMKKIITSANGLSEYLVDKLKGVDISITQQLVTKL